VTSNFVDGVNCFALLFVFTLKSIILALLFRLSTLDLLFYDGWWRKDAHFNLLAQQQRMLCVYLSLIHIMPWVFRSPPFITDRIYGSFVSLSPLKWKTPHFDEGQKIRVKSRARKKQPAPTQLLVAKSAISFSKVIIDPSIGNTYI
jgi:hypothetical protein